MKNKKVSRASKKYGLKPGSVVYVGKERTEEVNIDVIDYNENQYEEKRLASVEESFQYRESKTLSWINVDGIHRADIVEKIGHHYNIHDLVLEDVVNTGHRPKIEETENYMFLVLKMLYHDSTNSEIKSEQVSIIFGKTWVITFQETVEDVFNMVRKRIKTTVPRVRFMTSGYLAYALVDAIVDHYFIALEQLGDEIETLDDAVSNDPKPKHLDQIRDLKKKLIDLRKLVWPLREVIGTLERTESDLIHESTEPYIRDLYEHTIQVIDTVETYRDMVSSLLDLYHTGVSNRLNDIMKVLTMFATIFIPLGFLAGVYGMNFDTSVSPFNLPELGFRFGYIFFWSLVVCVAGGLLWFFRRKNWF